MKLISFSILLLTGTGLLASEKDTVRQNARYLISFNSGYSAQIVRDQVISPFIYFGTTAPAEINYQRITKSGFQQFSIHFSQSRLRSKIAQYPDAGVYHYIKSTTIDLRYSWQSRLTTFSDLNLDLYSGAEINSFLNTRDHYFTSNNNYLMIDCFNSLSLCAAITKRLIHDSQISLNVSVPVVSYVLMRQTYNAYVGEKTETLDLGKNVLYQLVRNGDVVSVSKLLDLKSDLILVKSFGKHFGVNLKYSFHYYKFTQYDNLFYSRNLISQVLAGIVYKL